MSVFIETTDYNAAIHAEILAALTRNDEAAIEMCEDMAIEDMKGYMGQRYNCDTIFAATGEDRNKLVLMMAIDITLYHIHSAHNPQRFPQTRKDRYDRAIKWLEMVQSGKIVPNGLPLKEDADGNLGGAAAFSITSNTKRENIY
jgi:phage gp36-like protein